MTINQAEALQIAREDAESVYVDLSIYAVTVELEDAAWRVTYRPADPYTAGGGPSYLISAETGEILERRYEQ